MSMITECPSEFASMQEEQAHMDALYDAYVDENVDRAKANLGEMLDLLNRVPRYLNQIKSILKGNGQDIILQTILQPLQQAIIDVEFNLEASEQLRLEQKPDRPEVAGNDKGES
jgi:hypothetical protein